MYDIHFYSNKKGREPVRDYLLLLAGKKGKDDRIRLNKIQDYIQILSLYGTQAGEPYMKHIEGELWELRPVDDRIFFTSGNHGQYILLHHFTKKSRKTPGREIQRARRNLADFKERNKAYEA